MEPFLGQIQPFGFNFAPNGWAMCSGQIMSIAQNTALFSLLGTTYGGNGQTTFALPDLRGRSIVHQGQGPGLSNITLGESSGVENVTLIVTNMPAHNHPLTLSLALNLGGTPEEMAAGHYLAANQKIWSEDPLPGAQANPGSITTPTNATGIAGGSQPFNIRNPYLGITVCIALEGIYPSRN
jgi:microcystin-dependent protein